MFVFLLLLLGTVQSVPERCALPLETGPCRASFQNYGYNVSIGQCQVFTYGGCDGNDNRFDSLEECQKTCGGESDVCSLPVVSGPCRAYNPRYGFNSTTGQCDRFIYGGCKGNGNRFNTIEECEETCGYPWEVCYLPIVTGPCKGAFTSYGYNSETGLCEEFVYGGCQGNANRFGTMEECQKRCGESTNVCSLPIVQGPCDASIPSYGFNSTFGTCDQFIYGGCDGNGNRFDSYEDCWKRCILE